MYVHIYIVLLLKNSRKLEWKNINSWKRVEIFQDNLVALTFLTMCAHCEVYRFHDFVTTWIDAWKLRHWKRCALHWLDFSILILVAFFNQQIFGNRDWVCHMWDIVTKYQIGFDVNSRICQTIDVFWGLVLFLSLALSERIQQCKQICSVCSFCKFY